jgi:OPA family glycerol-3-phosphate transporter-like MFS transporter
MKNKMEFKKWQARVFWTVLITYAFYYLLRVNISLALPGIMGEFGLTKTEMGLVLSAFFATYAIGQLVNGQLGDKFGARKLIAAGLFGSALINAVFGFTDRFLSGMILLWALNGFFQATGWAPSVKTIANWFAPAERGKIGGRLGTSYQIGNAFSWALSGAIIGLLGWRWAFWIPAALAIFVIINWIAKIRNAPEEAGFPSLEEMEKGITKSKSKEDFHLGFKFTLWKTLSNPRVWIVAFGLFFLNIVRYGFISWAPTYLFEIQGASMLKATFQSLMFPIAGSFGALFAGWVSDKKFGSRRAPISVIMLLLLAVFAFLFPLVPPSEWVLSILILMVVGFMTFGPHVLMVGVMAMDFGTRKAASSAAGFIDCMGYVGAAFTGIASGFLVDQFGWGAAFNFWVVSAVLAAGMMALLWNYKPKKEQYH